MKWHRGKHRNTSIAELHSVDAPLLYVACRTT